MAEIGINLAEKLIKVVGSKAIKEICSIWGYKSQLKNLKNTITTIRQVLLDAESKDQLSNEAQDYIHKLNEAVYAADDLFDEFLTLAELKQHNKDGKLSEKGGLGWTPDDGVAWMELGDCDQGWLGCTLEGGVSGMKCEVFGEGSGKFILSLAIIGSPVSR